MSFSSYSDLIAEITAGKFQRIPFQRTLQTGAASVAGRWHEGFSAAGTGGPGTAFTGTAGLGAALTNANAGSIPLATNTVTPDTQHLTTLMAYTPATTAVPGILMLTDLLYVYPSCVVTTGAGTTLSNAAGKPTRFNSGAGVQCSAVVNAALGAASPVITASYTNQSGTAGRTGTFAASANSLPLGSFLSGGGTAALGGPHMALQAGDSGVQQIDSYTTATGTTGSVAFVLHRPIATIPLVSANTPGERDFVNQFVSMPRVQDAACLTVFALVGGALATGQIVYGEIQAAWG